jgi:hypothetical protein
MTGRPEPGSDFRIMSQMQTEDGSQYIKRSFLSVEEASATVELTKPQTGSHGSRITLSSAFATKNVLG